MRQTLIACLLCLFAAPLMAQITTAPLEQTPAAPRPLPPPKSEAPAYEPAAPVQAQPQQSEPPPVLPQNPIRRALEAAATGGSGGMSYAGPSGAMNSSPNGSSCAVTCALEPRLEQHETSCASGFTAMCQCDTPPFAGCRRQ